MRPSLAECLWRRISDSHGPSMQSAASPVLSVMSLLFRSLSRDQIHIRLKKNTNIAAQREEIKRSPRALLVNALTNGASSFKLASRKLLEKKHQKNDFVSRGVRWR